MAVLGNVIYISLEGTKIAALKSCKLSNGCETIEIASPTTGGWRDFIAGRKEWSMSCSWLVLSTSAMKTDALKVGTTYTIAFTDGTTSISGSAICVKADVEANMGALAKGSFQFQGKGALS